MNNMQGYGVRGSSFSIKIKFPKLRRFSLPRPGNSTIIQLNLPLNDSKLSVITGKQVNDNFNKAHTQLNFQCGTNQYVLNVALTFCEF